MTLPHPPDFSVPNVLYNPLVPGKRGSVTRVCLLFEQLPDKGPVLLGYVQSLQAAREKLDELSKTTKSALFALDPEKKEIVLRVNVCEKSGEIDRERK